MTIYRLAIVAFMCWALQATTLAQARTFPYNFLDRINQPTAQQDAVTQSIAKQLAATAVPTAANAVQVAIFALLNTPDALAANEGVWVAGLYALGGDAPGFARNRELVWEVIISVGPDVRRVVWISTTTKAVRVLFRVDR